MPDDSQNELLSPRDIELWTRQELIDANRAHALRVRELTEIASACLSGTLTDRQANQMYDRYYARWGDALPISVGEQTTDEKIVRSLDEAAERWKVASKFRAESRQR